MENMHYNSSFADSSKFTNEVCNCDSIEVFVSPQSSVIKSLPPTSHHSNPILKVSKFRWLVLVAYCSLTMSAGSAWLCFPAVSNILQKYYDVSLLAVNMLTIIFGIAIIIFSIPFAIVLEKFGLAFTLNIASLMNAFGAGVRYFGADQTYGYWCLLFGNLLSAISVAGFLFLPGKISLTWFPADELGTATSICVAFDALGSGLAFLHATHMIKNDDDPVVVKHGIQSFLFSQMIPAFVIFMFTVVSVRAKPEYPPNLMEYEFIKQEKEEKSLLQAELEHSSQNTIKVNHSNTLKVSIIKLLKNPQFNLIMHMQGIVASVEGIYEILLNELLIEIYPGQEQSIGIIGFVAVIFGFISNIVVGIIIDKTGYFDRVSFVIFLTSTLFCIAWYILMVNLKNLVLKGIIFCLLMSICTSYYTVAFAHSTVITPSIPPSATGVLLVLSSQIYDTITSFILTEMLAYFGPESVYGVSIGACLLAAVMALYVKNESPTKPQSV